MVTDYYQSYFCCATLELSEQLQLQYLDQDLLSQKRSQAVSATLQRSRAVSATFGCAPDKYQSVYHFFLKRSLIHHIDVLKKLLYFGACPVPMYADQQVTSRNVLNVRFSTVAHLDPPPIGP